MTREAWPMAVAVLAEAQQDGYLPVAVVREPQDEPNVLTIIITLTKKEAAA